MGQDGLDQNDAMVMSRKTFGTDGPFGGVGRFGWFGRSGAGLAALVVAVALGAQATAATAAGPALRLTRVGTAEEPVGLVARRGDTALYVVEQRGIVHRLNDKVSLLDMRDQVNHDSEQGLLGLAFSVDAKTAYVDLTNTLDQTEIRSYSFDGKRFTKPRLLIKIAHPYTNHNGGQLVVDGDGVLWIGTGDGGNGGDPSGNGQSPSALLGKILRIVPRPSGAKAYGIPAGNAKTGRPEIWAMGMRNPWRFSIDQKTRTVWIGDVGQDSFEEIDAVPADKAGVNFGWNNREGLHPFAGGRKASSALTDPVYEYSHANGGCSVTGGFVYRGSKVPGLHGQYVFSDFCDGGLWSLLDGALRNLGRHVDQPTSFGVDNAGELYVLSLTGSIFRIDPP